MGNDGGSIPKRRELVKEAAKHPTSAQLKESLIERQEYHWSTDPLTNKPLSEPVVSDCNGILYSKESILEFLIPSEDADVAKLKAEQEKSLAGAVKRLKDVVEIKFNKDSESGKWICPVKDGLVLGAGTKAVYIVPCGHAFSEAGLAQVGIDKTCPTCEVKYEQTNVIPILPTTEADMIKLATRISSLRDQGLSHSLSKVKSSKKRKNKDQDDDKIPNLIDTTKTASGIKNSSTASLTAKVLREQDERNKKRKLQNNQNLNSLFTKDTAGTPNKKHDFMTRGFTIPAKDR